MKTLYKNTLVTVLLTAASLAGAPVFHVTASAADAPSAVPSPTATVPVPRLVDLGAGGCIPCKMMAPILEGLKKEYTGRMQVDFIDVWKSPDAGKEYSIRMIPTQIFFDSAGKELFRHEGFISKDDILAKWKEIGIEFGSKTLDGIVRETPVTTDMRSRDQVCFMCDGDVKPKTKTLVKGLSGQRTLCSPHCYFIYLSSIVNADLKAEESKVSVTDWSKGNLIAATTATYLYGMDATGRPTLKAFADSGEAGKELQTSPGSLVTWDVLRSKEFAARCGFCDRVVYPEDACNVKQGEARGYACCTHCAVGVAARWQKDIEIETKDGLSGELIRVKTLNGSVASLEPATAVAWFGQKKGPDGNWMSAGCFKQGFFVDQTNLQKWLDARPAMTGRQITIAQALADKMKLTEQQISKACKLGECK